MGSPDRLPFSLRPEDRRSADIVFGRLLYEGTIVRRKVGKYLRDTKANLDAGDELGHIFPGLPEGERHLTREARECLAQQITVFLEVYSHNKKAHERGNKSKPSANSNQAEGLSVVREEVTLFEVSA